MINKIHMTKESISIELKRKGYESKTVIMYTQHLIQLGEYYSPKKLNDITIGEIKSYFEYLKDRKKLSSSTRNTAKHAYRFWFNEVLKKEYDFKLIHIPRKYNRDAPEVFSEEEILTLISKADSLKNRLVISLAYGCGFDVGEMLNIKCSDIDFKNRKIKVKFSRSNKMREAILPYTLIEDIKQYQKQYLPTKWLFEGNTKGTKMAQRSMQYIFIRLCEMTGLRKERTFRSLRYSYSTHLQKHGVTILSILKELNLNSQQSYYAFSTIGETDEKVTVSPLDYLFGRKDSPEFKVDKLMKTVEKVQNEEERDFLIDAIKCLRTGVARAGVIMSWNAAIRNIQFKLLKGSLHNLNSAIQKHNKGAKTISVIDDFASIKEDVVLKASVDVNEFDKNEKDILTECLNLRNKCGHPGKYKPEPLRTAAFIEDLITIVFSK